MAARYDMWSAGGWIPQDVDASAPRCSLHEATLIEVESNFVCPSCVLARWTEVLAVALPWVPRGESRCEGHGLRARLRDREVCPTCAIADLRQVIRGGGLSGAVENGRVVLRAPGRQSCTKHGMPLATDGRSFVCVWCLPFLAAATERGAGQVFRPGDGSLLGSAMELTNDLALATADRKWRTVEVHLDPTVPPVVDLPGAGDDPENLVALSFAATEEGEESLGLLIQQLAGATEQAS